MSFFTASIRENSNRVVSSSKCNWSGAKTGCYFRFKNDGVIYNVKKASSFSVFYPFELISNKTIKINTDIGINLSIGDELLIVYKEYELVTVFEILNKGKGYRVGDRLKLDSELPVIDISTGITEYSVLEVLETDSDGGILKINISTKGKYLKSPENELNCVGGSGKNGRFSVVFKEINTSQIIEREIEHIDYNVPCIIYLNSILPQGVTFGKISVNKWELFLSSTVDKNILNGQYEIIQDYTSHLSLPLLLPNSLSKEPLLNKSLTIIDEEIRLLKAEIEKLKLVRQ